jgi:acyl-CoA synthetase (AMP-forming)/AMP-acid ligase II
VAWRFAAAVAGGVPADWYRRTSPFLVRNASREGNLTSVFESSIPAVLGERASLQPNDPAVTCVDYDQDWDRVATTLTWSQLYRRVVNLGDQLRAHGSGVADLVLVSPGSIPITTSGKIRRSQCVDLYRQDEFARLDA